MTDEKKVDAELPTVELEPGMKYLQNKEMFEHGLRVAKMFAASKLVPDIYKNNPADCFLVLHRAMSLGLDPLFYMEHAYVVHGKVSVDGQLCKAIIDKSGLYKGDLELEYTGAGDTRKCTARAETIDGKVREADVSVALAKAEGWWSKKDSKWPTMTDQMLGYRAASFFVKRYHPALLGGAQTVEEMIDVNGVTVIRGRRSALNEVLSTSKEKA
jgi:hypothetical protein